MKSNSRARRIFLVLAFLVLPFISSTETVEHELAPRFLYLSILIILGTVFLVWIEKGDSTSFLESKVGLAWLAFIWIGVVSSVFALNPQEAFFENSKNLLGLGFAAILYRFLSTNDSFEKEISVVICFYLIGILSIGGYQYMYQKDTFLGFTELVSTLSNPNLFASMLVICLPFVFIPFVNFSGVSVKLFSLVLGIATLIFIYLIWSKSSLLAFMIGMTVLGVIYIGKIGKAKFSKSTRYVGSGIILLVICGLSYYVFNIYYGKWADFFFFENAKIDTYDGNIERMMMWKNSIKMFWEFPFLGVGPGHWKLYFPKYGISGWYLDKSLIQFSTPHNDYFWVLTEYGILGFLAYTGVIVLIIKGFWSKIILQDGIKIWMYAALLAGFVAYLSDSFFSYPRERAMHIVFFSTYAAFSVGNKSAFIDLKKAKRIIYSILIVVLVLISYFLYQRFRAEKFLEKARNARTSKSWEYCIQSALKAEKLGLDYTPFYLEPVALTQGMAYDEMGRTEDAYICYERAYKAAPYHLYSMAQYAGVLYAQGKNMEALALLDETFKITPGFWYSWQLKALMLLKTNDIEGAWTALNKSTWTNEHEYNELSKEIFKARLIHTYERLPEGNVYLNCLKNILENDKIPAFVDIKFQSESGVMDWLKENKSILCESD